MDRRRFLLHLLPLVILLKPVAAAVADNGSFSRQFHVIWGADHTKVDEDRRVQIFLDRASGAGFESLKYYGSGIFRTNLKIPDKNSSGVITAYYLTSRTNNHDEVDMEFMGSNGPPYTYKLSTNLFLGGKGGREQVFELWFDPTEAFHKYTIVWNKYRIMWFVDNLLVRVYGNNRTMGAGYATQAMKVEGSIWDGENWTRTEIDWTQAPFTASYKDLNIEGCEPKEKNGRGGVGVGVGDCYSSEYVWNGKSSKNLSKEDISNYEMVRSLYLTYDYCEDRSRYPRPPPECSR
ncbi:hypothetical protein MLD38_032675 [Melastoma candidum]|uniref:Uncharacterized protein n=1 Tax=Melastoma candidum TaxID=119954 RepID=A0ACB9M8L2_9MYRT|nr:hypothetical protein MLD38_032675 [Melastoma candidum]